MKTLISTALAVFMPVLLCAQNFSDQLSQVENNNTTLRALRMEAQAQAAEAGTGLLPDNPELELGYLWGTPAETGNRIDIALSQSFDFPTAYVWRSRIAKGLAGVADYEYLSSRREILLEAWSTCIEIVYRNAMASALKLCLDNASSLSESWTKKAASGDAGALDVNKARLNLLTVRKMYEENAIELEALSSELERLNGGQTLTVDTGAFMPAELPSDFDAWFDYACAAAPEMRQMTMGGKVADMQLNLAKTGWLPKFSIGYASERIAGTTLQGIKGGISIPLWENRGRVKAAQARAEAARLRLEDGQLQFRTSMKALYVKGQKLQSVVDMYRKSLSEVNSLNLLKEALDEGEMSLLDYMLEQEVWIDALRETLESERDLQLIRAEMQSYIL